MPALVDLRQELTLLGSEATDPGATDPEATVKAAVAEGGQHSAYVIETVWDTLPEGWLENRALLARRISTDAPMGDLDLDEEDWDADRVREQWARGRAQGRRSVESVARHLKSDRLVGFTDLMISAATPNLGYQADTLVLREPMLRVNRELGFVVTGYTHEWQKRLG